MALRTTAHLETSVSLTLADRLRQELELSVNERVSLKWNDKIQEGIVPTEVKKRGEVNKIVHAEEMERLDAFVAGTVSHCLKERWKHAVRKNPKFIHFFGVGTGGAIERAARSANLYGYGLRAYDTCDEGCKNAERAFCMITQSPDRTWENEVFRADIEFACDRRFIQPENSTAIVIPRVLDILDKQEVGWTRTRVKKRKMPRVARKLGDLVTFVDVLLVHPCPEDNVGVVWGDTTPHKLDLVLEYMEEGAQRKIHGKKLGKVLHHGHTYTAVLVHA